MSQEHEGPEESQGHNEPEQGPVSQPEVAPPVEPAPMEGPAIRDRETNQWAMFIHLSILAGWAIPIAGLVVPVLLWQLKKDELPGIVPHAHIVMNWIVTSILYGIVCLILMVLVIGVFGMIALGIVTILFSIIGGIKANDGEVWEYPGTIIKIFK